MSSGSSVQVFLVFGTAVHVCACVQSEGSGSFHLSRRNYARAEKRGQIPPSTQPCSVWTGNNGNTGTVDLLRS